MGREIVLSDKWVAVYYSSNSSAHRKCYSPEELQTYLDNIYNRR